ncbi:MAG: CAP domain-containing protein [Polyangiaceae bacterium]
MWRLWVILAVALQTGCGPGPISDINPALARPNEAAAREDALTVEWSQDTRSPNPRPPHDTYATLESACGDPDERLDRAAGWLLRRGPIGRDPNDGDRLTFVLRAAGTPYVRPVAWAKSWTVDAPISPEALTTEATRWLSTLEHAAQRRCGLALVSRGTQRALGIISAQVLAELVLPLPTQTRVGRWLPFEARLLEGASQARLFVSSPQGEPHTLMTTLDGNRVRARIPTGSAGRWQVQLLGADDSGPRPLLEATIHVDEEPETVFVPQPVPGQTVFEPEMNADLALTRLVAATRRETGRGPLRRDVALDRLAQEQAVAMRRAGRVGHEVGEGSTRERLERGGIRTRLAGENVAHAADALRVHRALWSSPSHRTNLLHRGFSRFGLAVATDLDGTLWVCELFASSN